MSKSTNSKKAKRLNALETLLEKHKDEFQTLSNGKIKCLITGHEFLPSEQNLLDHLKSKSYKKATQSNFDIAQYEDILQTHKDNEHFLFCRLTGAKVPKKKTSILKHTNGRKFKHRLQEYRKLQAEQQELQDGQEGVQQQQQDDEEFEDEQQQDEEDEQQQQQIKPAVVQNGKNHPKASNAQNNNQTNGNTKNPQPNTKPTQQKPPVESESEQQQQQDFDSQSEQKPTTKKSNKKFDKKNKKINKQNKNKYKNRH